MEIFNYIITFIDIVLFIWLSLIMIRRVICRAHNKNRLQILVKRLEFYGDIFILIGVLMGLFSLTNKFILTTVINQNIYWLIFRNFIVIGLLIKYRKSQPKILTHLIEEFKKTLYDNFNYILQR